MSTKSKGEENEPPRSASSSGKSRDSIKQFKPIGNITSSKRHQSVLERGEFSSNIGVPIPKVHKNYNKKAFNTALKAIEENQTNIDDAIEKGFQNDLQK